MDMTNNRTYHAIENWRFSGEGFRVTPPWNDPKAERGNGRDYPPDDARCVVAEMLIGVGDDRIRRFCAHRMEKAMKNRPFRDEAEVRRYVNTCLEEIRLVIRTVEGATEDDFNPASMFGG